MPKLSYKTKGNSNPQGKPRVYFCCHPEDFEKYFDSVYDEIMQDQNCAFYYDSEPDGEITEEWLSYLGEMQLFVVPVTTKFLTKENKGLSVEFPFAEEKHIPVLPLMQENGLDDVFSVKMGSLQYLNKYSEDKTGISYEEKLDKYLKSVLVGDELAQKIRDAFDAYIFLSYRKKDRVYAQQLMRLIHENEFCRDIAIWYDEFLTPGENFNSSIEEALKKSKLFALAVTPNLVNEENYVMNVEYPMAKGAGKTILPAEVVKTDRAELENKYDGIPACADAHNAHELSKALEDALKGIAIRENDEDPKHNFFIGLAYLSGIDVEVNHERALRLISSAAEAGLTEAMEKLVSMYRSGEGVERNYETAIEWQKCLVEVSLDGFQNEPTEENASGLCDSMISLGRQYERLYKYNQALDTYNELKLLLEQNLKDFACYEMYYSEVCRECGDIYREEGMLEEARLMYILSAENYKNVVLKGGHIGYIFYVYMRIAEICKDCGETDKAIETLNSTVEFLKNVFEENDLNAKNWLADAYDKLGSAYKSEGYNTEALKYFSLAFELHKAICAENEGIYEKASLVRSYKNLGGIYEKQGNLKKAEEAYLKELEISEYIHKEQESESSKRNLSIAYNQLGGVYESQERFDKAEELYIKAFEIDKELFEKYGIAKTKIGLAISYESLGDLYSKTGMLEEAREMYTKSYELSESMFNEKGTIEFTNNYLRSCLKLGNIYKKDGEADKTEEMYSKAYTGYKFIFEKVGTMNAAVRYTACCVNIGEFYISEGFYDKARNAFSEAQELCEALLEKKENNDLKKNISTICYDIGDICVAERKYDKALNMYSKAIALDESYDEELERFEKKLSEVVDITVCESGEGYQGNGELNKAKKRILKIIAYAQLIFVQTNTAAVKRFVAGGYEKFASVCEKAGELEEAEKNYVKALELLESDEKEKESVENQRHIFKVNNGMARSHEAQGDCEKAKAMFISGLEIGKPLLKKATNEFLSAYSANCSHLSDIYKAEGQLEEAKKYCSEAVEYAKKVYVETGSVQSRTDFRLCSEKLEKIKELIKAEKEKEQEAKKKKGLFGFFRKKK